MPAKNQKKQSVKSLGSILTIVGVVLLILIIAIYGESLIDWFSSHVGEQEAITLTIEEEAFVDQLLEEWSQDFRLTSVRQTALNEGLEYNHDFRYRIASYLAVTPSIHRQLLTWRTPTFVLTNEEKRVAKYILIRNTGDSSLPSMTEMKKALGLDEDVIEEAFFILYQLGFLDKEQRFRFLPATYSLNPKHEEYIPQWCLHYFEIVREDGRKFNVQCILDALKMVYEDFIGEEITINTYCPDCLQSIQIVARMGELAEVRPPSTIVLKGGTCPTNLAFVGSSHMERWMKDKTGIEDRRAHTLEELLELIKEER